MCDVVPNSIKQSTIKPHKSIKQTNQPTIFIMLNKALEIKIEHNAYVCQSCRISLSEDIDHNNSNVNGNGNVNGTAKIKLIIGSGNVFHPNARLTIIPPPPPNNSTIDNDSTNDNDAEITVRIGSNNLFEEESHCILDLSHMNILQNNDDNDIDNDDNADEERIHTAMGSYNQLSAGAQLKCTSIGNANIFHPKCNVSASASASASESAPVIQNGNIFQACFHNGTDNGDNNGDASVPVMYQEKVCFLSGESLNFEHEPPVRKIRNHTNGVQRNIREVSLLLNAAKRVVQKHHRLMA